MIIIHPSYHITKYFYLKSALLSHVNLLFIKIYYWFKMVQNRGIYLFSFPSSMKCFPFYSKAKATWNWLSFLFRHVETIICLCNLKIISFELEYFMNLFKISRFVDQCRIIHASLIWLVTGNWKMHGFPPQINIKKKKLSMLLDLLQIVEMEDL